MMTMSDCRNYVEDPAICYDDGEPKGQCLNCGAKWYEHTDDALPESERVGVEETRQYQASLAPKH